MARKSGTRRTRKKTGAAGPAQPARAGRTAGPSKRRPWLWRVIWAVLRWPVRIVLVLGLLAVLWVAAYGFINPPGGIYMATEAWRLGKVQREWRDIERISPRLARAVIAAEDARFCAHPGFDVEAIRAALEASEQGRRLRGGSTITQQVAKNVFLWHERSWLRKGLEAGFTVLIEVFWSKRRIVEVYMNTVEFAPGVFGAEAAAQHHFGRPALALTPLQAARLAAVLPNPKTRSASAPSDFVRRRTRAIMDGAATLRADGRADCALH